MNILGLILLYASDADRAGKVLAGIAFAIIMSIVYAVKEKKNKQEVSPKDDTDDEEEEYVEKVDMEEEVEKQKFPEPPVDLSKVSPLQQEKQHEKSNKMIERNHRSFIEVAKEQNGAELQIVQTTQSGLAIFTYGTLTGVITRRAQETLDNKDYDNLSVCECSNDNGATWTLAILYRAVPKSYKINIPE